MNTPVQIYLFIYSPLGQNVVEIIILFVFFPTITSKYVQKLSVKILFLSVFDFLGLRGPHFKKLDIFMCSLELWGFLIIKLENLPISTAIANESYS